MGCGGQEEQMATSVVGNLAEQFVSLLLVSLTLGAGVCGGMSFIYDNEVGAMF